MWHKENKAFLTSIYKINRILQKQTNKGQDSKGKSSDKAKWEEAIKQVLPLKY
jgi:hypothetical protein